MQIRKETRVHTKLRVLASIGGATVGLLMLATPAFATAITSPSANPYTVPGDATGAPQPFTVTGSGFTPSTQVYIEQCDGVSPTVSGYDPSEHCDVGTSPSGFSVQSDGVVTFLSTSSNFKFRPVKGLSPQGLFTCGAPSDTDPNDGTPYFENCQVRVASSRTAVTSDQQYFTMVMPDAVTPPPDTPEAPFAILLPVGGVAAAAAFLTIRNRRGNRPVAA